eukprot:1050465-Pleurochrysis_carterae.AAC.4
MVYQDFSSVASGTPEFAARAPRLAMVLISTPERARAVAVVFSTDTGGVANNDVAFAPSVGLEVCGDKFSFFVALSLLALAPLSAAKKMPSSVASVYSPWSSSSSAAASITAGLIVINRNPKPLTPNASSPFPIGSSTDETGRHAMFMRFALLSRAFLILPTCCLFLRTLLRSGPGKRGSR